MSSQDYNVSIVKKHYSGDYLLIGVLKFSQVTAFTHAQLNS